LREVRFVAVDDSRTLAGPRHRHLTRVFAYSLSETYQGRLRQALDAEWVFVTATGQNGVVGINLGQTNDGWTSTDSPAQGLTVHAEFNEGTSFESVMLSSRIPAEFTD
jgi:hypothetical protein